MNLAKANKGIAKKKFGEGFKVPHTLVIISAIILLVAVATYLVPGGAYEKIVNIMVYASKIKKNPKLSPVYEIDQKKRQNLACFGNNDENFLLSHKIILLLLAACMGIIVLGD